MIDRHTRNFRVPHAFLLVGLDGLGMGPVRCRRSGDTPLAEAARSVSGSLALTVARIITCMGGLMHDTDAGSISQDIIQLPPTTSSRLPLIWARYTTYLTAKHRHIPGDLTLHHSYTELLSGSCEQRWLLSQTNGLMSLSMRLRGLRV